MGRVGEGVVGESVCGGGGLEVFSKCLGFEEGNGDGNGANDEVSYQWRSDADKALLKKIRRSPVPLGKMWWKIPPGNNFLILDNSSKSFSILPPPLSPPPMR